MNEPAAIEIAFATVIREFAELGAGAYVRAWQTPSDDPEWNEGNDRYFPLVEARCTGPSPDESAQATMRATTTILCGTEANDDPSRAGLRVLYSGVREVCDALFRQWRSGTDGAEKTRWHEALNAALGETDAARFVFGGFTFGDGAAPVEEGMINVLAVSLNVHYARTDY